jgi:hypothetical protein
MSTPDLTSDEVAQIAEEMRQRRHDCDLGEAMNANDKLMDAPWDLDRTRFEREA